MCYCSWLDLLVSPSDLHKESRLKLSPLSVTSAPPSIQLSWPEARQLPSCSSPAHQIPTVVPQRRRLAGPRHCRADQIRDWQHRTHRQTKQETPAWYNMQKEKILSDDAVINPEESVFMCTYSKSMLNTGNYGGMARAPHSFWWWNRCFKIKDSKASFYLQSGPFCQHCPIGTHPPPHSNHVCAYMRRDVHTIIWMLSQCVDMCL